MNFLENYCKNCGKELASDTNFCPDCGKKVENNPQQLKENILYCHNCGAKIEHENEFCENCGSSLIPNEKPKYMEFLEKNKIPLIVSATIIVILLIVVATISLTQAPVDVGTQTVSVGSNRFEIPGDYVIDPSSIYVDYTGYNVMFSQAYSNGDEMIYIAVMNIPYNVDSESVAASQGGVHKSLMGVSGYYSEDNGVYTFAFVDGAYLNVVSATSPYVLDEITYLG